MSSIKVFLVAVGISLVAAWVLISMVSLVKMWRAFSGGRGTGWAFVQAIPLSFLGTAFLMVIGFWSLLVCGWYWIRGKPTPVFRRMDSRDEDVV